MKAHDVRSALGDLAELRFHQLSTFNRGHVGVFRASRGTSPWERHPDDDELLQIFEGEAEIEVLTDGGPERTTVRAGSVFVVPRGLWHRHVLRGPMAELYVTPGATEHSTAEDPRAAAPPPGAALPDPQLVMQYLNGHWAAIALATAVENAIFAHVENGADTPDALARAADLAPRGARALLDGLVGLGLLTVSAGRYANTPAASFYLVEGKPAYQGAWATRLLSPGGDLALWSQLPAVVKRGGPERRVDPAFFDSLVLALAPAAWPVAQQVAERLGFAALGDARVLDVGGGAGAWSAALLLANPRARATQVDSAGVNRIARDYVGRFGVADRFETRDGDFHEADLGDGAYDVAILSHIAHGEGPDENRALFGRLRRALKTGGTLVVVDFLVDDGRAGPPFPLLFHLVMLLATAKGATWQRADYERWLGEAGFTSVAVEPAQGAASVILAR